METWERGGETGRRQGVVDHDAECLGEEFQRYVQ